MKKGYLSRFLIYLVMAVLILGLGLAILLRQTFVNGSMLNGLVGEVNRIVALPFKAVNDTGASIANLFKVYSENERLKKTIYSLENQSLQLAALQEENNQLKDNLKVQSGSPLSTLLTAEVLSRTPVSWYQNLTLSAGNSQGLKEDMLVLSNGGVIGRIQSVSANTAQVDLLSNTGKVTALSVKIKSGEQEVFGLLTDYDRERGAFLVTNLNVSTALSLDSQVLTSGLDGLTSADLPVGQVVEVLEDADPLKRKVYVKPLADFANISYVTVAGD